MARALKWILIVLAAVVVLLIGTVVAIVVLVDPNAYKDEIAQAVERRTGRELVIEGDISLTFFPWLGLELGRAHLSDAPGFGDQPFVQLDGARLAVAVWPLLSERKLVLDKIVVDGLGVRLIRDQQGRGNWEDLVERFAKEEQPPAEPAPQEQDGQQIAIESEGGLELNNATILWEDRQSGARYLVDPLNLTVSDLNLDNPIPVRATWALQAADAPDVGGEIAARLRYDQAAKTFQIDDLALDALLRGEQIPSGELKASLRGGVQGDLNAQRYTVPEATLQVAGVVAKLAAQASTQGETLTADAKLNMPAFNARELMRRLGMEAPQTADPNALANVALAANLQYDGKSLAVQDLNAQVDDTSITGQVRVPSFEPLAANFRLAADQINLDRYLAPEQETPAGGGQAPSGGQAPAGESQQESELPVEALRNLNLDGVVTVGKLVVKKLDINELKAQITARDGIIRAEPVAQLYQGQMRAELKLDATGEQPQFSMQQRLEGVQAGSLLEDLIGVARILGIADFNLEANMQGMSVDEWLRTISGQASFKFADGAINGINVAQAIQVARAKLANEPMPADAEQARTPFNVLAGSLKIDEGLVINRDFNLASSLFKIAGDGKLNLLTREIDYTLNVALTEAFGKTDNKLVSELRDVPIPVEISGSYRDLDIDVDLLQALKQAGAQRLKAEEQKLKAKAQAEVEERKQEVRQEVEERKQELEQKVQERVQKGLQDLLKPRGREQPAEPPQQ
jgi:AsmA protein